jgi:F-type H+-transporting ATPase subunit b
MITFALLVAFTMKYVWPHLMKAISDRQLRIAEGLAAADRSKHELELAQHKSADLLHEAKAQAATYIEQANKRAAEIVEEAKHDARRESDRLLTLARAEIEIERSSAREALRQDIAGIALQSAQKVLGKVIDVKTDDQLIEQLIAEVAGE